MSTHRRLPRLTIATGLVLSACGGPATLPDSPSAALLIDGVKTRFVQPRLEEPKERTPARQGRAAAAQAATGSADEAARVPVLGPAVARRFDRDGGQWRPRFDRGADAAVRVALPTRADGAMQLRDVKSGLELDVRLDGARAIAAEGAGGYLVYRRAHASGADLLHRPTGAGTEDFLSFETAPLKPEVSYTVRPGAKVAGLRLVGDALEFVDGDGTPRLRVAPPSLVDVQGRRAEAHLAVAGCAYDRSPVAPWGRAPIAPGAEACTVTVSWDPAGVTYPMLLDPTWSNSSGTMTTVRLRHASATTVIGGQPKILIVSGFIAAPNILTSTCELYDPVTDTFSATGSVANPRGMASLINLGDGSNRVLLAGGATRFIVGPVGPAELYSPTMGSWSAAGTMANPRFAHGGVRFDANNMLFFGGTDGGTIFNDVERWSGGFFVPAGTLVTGRTDMGASVLLDGRVLVSGGFDGGGARLASMEIFNAGVFAAAPVSLIKARGRHTQTTLLDGRVLFTGGNDSGGSNLNDAEIYDVLGGTVAVTGAMTNAMVGHRAVRLLGGGVLVSGPNNGATELYNPLTNTFSVLGTLVTPRLDHTLDVLPSGKALVTGGEDTAGFSPLASAEIFTNLVNGTACVSAVNCDSGFCVDGVCCNAACGGGPCEACNLPGLLGACSPRSVAVQCRAAAGVCDVAESCDGVNGACPTDAFVPVATQCRAAVDLCDSAEACTGAAAACPADLVKPLGTTCRGAAALCDAPELCDGVATACPADLVLPIATPCRAAVDVCDAAEACDGVAAACPADLVLPIATPCRAAIDVCDVAEACDGAAAACPADGFVPVATQCRAAVDICDAAEACTGVGAACPVDDFKPFGTSCRPAVDLCDAAEVCSGIATACPADLLKVLGTTCRAAAGGCDAAETCSGVATACPGDLLRPAGFACRASSGPCDVGEVCDGVLTACPADVMVSQACAAACGLGGGCGFTDTDGDGLNDTWETQGYIDLNCNGVNDLGVDTPLPGADVNKPNLYVKYDYMTSGGHDHAPSPAALAKVVAAFAAKNVILAFFPTVAAIPEKNVVSLENPGALPACAGTEGVNAVSLYTIKSLSFPSFLLPAYHYALFAHHNTCGSEIACATCPASVKTGSSPSFGATGVAERPGNDLVISFGDYIDTMTPITDEMVAGTFLHELGHNLNLRHGGGDDTLFKPHYFSVMNYSYQFGVGESALPGPYVTTTDGATVVSYRVDFSDADLGALHEGSNLGGGLCGSDGSGGLNENVGLPGAVGRKDVANFIANLGADFLYAPSNGSPIDWNFNGNSTNMGVFSDLTGDGQCEVLNGYEDWASTTPAPGVTKMTNLTLGFQCNTGFWIDGVARSPGQLEDAELTHDLAAELHLNYPRLTVRVNVRPGCGPNWIDFDSAQLLPVVAYGSPTFDAAQVDLSSLRFGGAAAASAVLGDVDGDGRVDVTAYFAMSSLSIGASATTGTLSGALASSQAFAGSDAITSYGTSGASIDVAAILDVHDDTKSGACGPGGKKDCELPIAGMLVLVFDRDALDGLTIARIGGGTVTLRRDPPKSLYGDIYASAATCGLSASSCVTAADGPCAADLADPGKYLVIGRYQEGGVTVYPGDKEDVREKSKKKSKKNPKTVKLIVDKKIHKNGIDLKAK